MLRKALTLFGVLALLLSVFAFTGGSAHAANDASLTASFTSSIDFSTLAKTCKVIRVDLNGKSHTVTCLQTQAAAKMHPSLGRDNNCNQGDLQVLNYKQTSTLCFYGSGSLDVRIYQVNQVYNATALGSSFDYIPADGGYKYQYVNGYSNYIFNEFNDTNVTVVWLCLENYGTHYC